MLADNVARLLRSVRTTPPEGLPLMLELIEQRKKWIEAEVAMERMLLRATLPPSDGFSLEYLFEPESEVLMGYLRLLDWLDESARSIRQRLGEQKGQAGASEG